MSTGDPGDSPPGSPPRGAPTPAPRAIQLTVTYPTFNWDQGNPHEQFKWFKHRTEILMEGPYEDYKDPDKVAAILGWLGDKGHQHRLGSNGFRQKRSTKMYSRPLHYICNQCRPPCIHGIK